MTEAVFRWCFSKKLFLKFRKFRWKTAVSVSLFNQPLGLQLYSIETPTQVFSYEILKNNSGGCFCDEVLNTIYKRKSNS